MGSNNDMSSLTSSCTDNAQNAGVTYYRWNGISGSGVQQLLASQYAAGVAGADETSVMQMFESPVNVCDNCGTMMEGYFRAAADGAHIFQISADDNAHLWFGADINHMRSKHKITPFVTGIRLLDHSNRASESFPTMYRSGGCLWVAHNANRT